MFASRPLVHPMEVATPADPAVQPPPGVLMKDLPGMQGTPGGLGLRVLQLLFAAISLGVMSSTVDFADLSAFCYLIATMIMQCVWSLTVAIVDIYALLVKRCLRNHRVVTLFAIGNGVAWVVSFSGACAVAGITGLLDQVLHQCFVNHCPSFQTAVAMGFMCCFALLPSFLLNFYSTASSHG